MRWHFTGEEGIDVGEGQGASVPGGFSAWRYSGRFPSLPSPLPPPPPGGVKKEFFQLLMGQLLSPDYGMLMHQSESNTYW